VRKQESSVLLLWGLGHNYSHCWAWSLQSYVIIISTTTLFPITRNFQQFANQKLSYLEKYIWSF